MELHNPEFIWADAYLIFERIMDIGVKDFYYKEVESKVIEISSPQKASYNSNFKSVDSCSSRTISFKSADSQNSDNNRIKKYNFLKL